MENQRSGKLLAINDKYINELLNDSNYKVERNGKIYSLRLDGQWKEVIPTVKGGGYLKLRYNGKHLQVHRIIYAAFVGPLKEDLVIKHMDAISNNNTPENLMLDTQGSNNQDRYRLHGHKAVPGHSRINQKIADEIRADQKTGMTNRQLREKYGLSKGSISEIVNNNIWKGDNLEITPSLPPREVKVPRRIQPEIGDHVKVIRGKFKDKIGFLDDDGEKPNYGYVYLQGTGIPSHISLLDLTKIERNDVDFNTTLDMPTWVLNDIK